MSSKFVQYWVKELNAGFAYFFLKNDCKEAIEKSQQSTQEIKRVSWLVPVSIQNIHVKKKRNRKKLHQRLCSNCIKLDKGTFRAGLSMGVGDDTISDFTVDNYAALMLKHPQNDCCTVSDSTKVECFQRPNFLRTKFYWPCPTCLVQV